MKEPTTTVSLRESVQRVADPENLDATVDEVFRLMLGVDCRRETAQLVPETESLTAVVGFGGLLSGACVFSCGGSAAPGTDRCPGAIQTGG